MITFYTIVIHTVLYLRQQTKLFINANRKNVINTNLRTLKCVLKYVTVTSETVVMHFNYVCSFW